jgi:hypothetical protein
MRQASGDANLAQESFGANRGGEFLLQHFDSHLPPMLSLLGEVHGCHAALAQKALDHVSIGERVGEGSRRVAHSRNIGHETTAGRLPAALEELHRALVFFRGSETFERAKITPPPRFRIPFSGIEPVLSRF